MDIEEMRRREVAILDELALVVKAHLAAGTYNTPRKVRHVRGALNRIAAQRYRLTGKRADLDGTQEESDN